MIRVEVHNDMLDELSYSSEIYYRQSLIVTPSLFKTLLEAFVPDKMFDHVLLCKNMRKATELYEYLITDDKTVLYPIQEIIMGSGKTTAITPYICVLLLNKFISERRDYENEIYIVLPESLVKQSFKILMKNLFPLFNNVEILTYPNKPQYENSFKIYLTSDTNYKIMFLEKTIDTSKKYMIYDEVDMMANPLTCELNIPDVNKPLESGKYLYLISNILYNKIFKNNEFWGQISNYESNEIHTYIYNLVPEMTDIIYKYYDELMTRTIESELRMKIKDLIDYIKDNVLLFILTKQYNFDYGLPEKYTNQEDNYKFKAIPYAAVDNPLLGSEFSDPVLTYVLTVFCYKIRDGYFRKIDKDKIVNHYESLYNKTNNELVERTLFSFFTDKPNSFKHYTNYKVHFKETYEKKFNLDNTQFDIIIEEILALNNNFYSLCRNISFNDLLLYKNVKNFVCFTGTAFITPPQDESNSFEPDKYINYGEIYRFSKVTDAIQYIIRDPSIVQKFYTNTTDVLMDNIFSCLTNYDVLIDIGGIFVKYSNSLFIEEYKKLSERKDYIVYFDNGNKIIYNLNTDLYVNENVITHMNAFYFFSNNNITGVDAKKMMNPKAHGLVTITNKTTLRDFSQGIFRLRGILPNPEKRDLGNQTVDIIYNKKFEGLMKGGCSNFNNIRDVNIRENIITNLINQQHYADKQKLQILTKQNIFALLKTSTSNDDNKQILYIEPLEEDYNKNLRLLASRGINSFNLDALNIIDKTQPTTTPFVTGLVDRYFSYKMTMKEATISQARANDEEQQQQQQEQEENSKEIAMIYKPIDINKNSFVFYNFKVGSTSENQIICTWKINMNLLDVSPYNFVLIYDSLHNNLAMITLEELVNFLIYNQHIINNYTIISLYNNSIYGKPIENNLVLYLRKIILKLLIVVINTIDGENESTNQINASKDLKNIIDRLIKYDYDPNYIFNGKILKLNFLHLGDGRNNNDFKELSNILDREQNGEQWEPQPEQPRREREPISSYDDFGFNKYMKYKMKYIKLKKQLNL
jgi:hypothetical protein